MRTDDVTNKFGILIAALMIAAGVFVAVRLFSQPPTRSMLSAADMTITATAKKTALAVASQVETPTPVEKGPLPQFTIGITDELPGNLMAAIVKQGSIAVQLPSPADNESVDFVLSYDNAATSGGLPVYQQIFTVVDRFDTVTSSIPWNQVQSAWKGENPRYPVVAVLAENAPALESVLGAPGQNAVQTFPDVDSMKSALYEETADLALAPFDLLQPELSVLDIDGQSPLLSDGRFDLAEYPLVATVYAHSGGVDEYADRIPEYITLLPTSNRDTDRMTTIAMTGVTAMVRYTAARMDQEGAEWPAANVGPELAAADITVISNEVPFIEGCETDLDPDNVVFCSKPSFMQALHASGADIVGLTGNHLNDYGREGGLQSLQYYADAGLKVYGGGEDKLSAMQPIVVEHNGNRIGFIGANSYGPPEAWATDFGPGSAPYDINIMSAMIRGLKADDEADVVLAELQYQESYDATPLPEQRLDFRALVRAGADVVTGVQSHVPQAVEFLDGNLILYGLGNLFFDQMWQQETRDGLIVLHTIYDGRHISTRLLPTVLQDYGQPQFASSVDRARILERIFSSLPQ